MSVFQDADFNSVIAFSRTKKYACQTEPHRYGLPISCKSLDPPRLQGPMYCAAENHRTARHAASIHAFKQCHPALNNGRLTAVAPPVVQCSTLTCMVTSARSQASTMQAASGLGRHALRGLVTNGMCICGADSVQSQEFCSPVFCVAHTMNEMQRLVANKLASPIWRPATSQRGLALLKVQFIDLPLVHSVHNKCWRNLHRNYSVATDSPRLIMQLQQLAGSLPLSRRV